MAYRKTIRSMSTLSALLFTLTLTAKERIKEFTVPSDNGDITWYEIFPGDGTICARGQEYSFFYYPGRSDKLLIDFIGGGACWNAESCAKESATFVDSVDYLRDLYLAGLKGYYRKDREDNPIRDWSHIAIPYCTGDIHWGNVVREYTRKNGTRFTIHHKGATNARAVLNWAHKKFTNPNNVLVAGCSGGAYGSIYWTPMLRQWYPDATFAQFADAGAGIVPNGFLQFLLPQWNALENGPTWLPIDWQNPTLPDLYVAVGHQFPDITISQYNNAFDATQTFFFELMGGEGQDFTPLYFETINKIKQNTTNFSSFTATGEDHCIVPEDRFYTTQEQNTRFADWFYQQALAVQQDSVSCENCSLDPAK